MEKKINFENGEWKVKEETIQFADEVTFTLSFYSLASKESSDACKKADPDEDKQAEQKPAADDFESIYLQDSDAAMSLSSPPPAQRIMVNLPPKSMADLLNKTNDFQAVSSNQAQTPSLAYWFGLCKFVVLAPTRANSYVDSESRAKVVLSSLSVAINNTGRSAYRNQKALIRVLPNKNPN